MTFESLGLIDPILKALDHEGYEKPTPIQREAIPYVLGGNDLLGCAQTGTGKTAAFAIPIIQKLAETEPIRGHRKIRALVLTPTRELAIQISESFSAYGKFTGLQHSVIFGGVGQHPQVVALKRGIDLLVATPGRLLDLMDQGYVHLNNLEIFVLDEADRMLDMGFIHDIRKVIAKLPVKRQSLFFSATMPADIVKLSSTILRQPKRVEVTPPATTAQKVGQQLYFVEKEEKKKLLISLLSDGRIDRVLVFTRTKHGANKVVKDLQKSGISAEAIHGNKSQNARQQALKKFKDNTLRVLVATDIAARGIDVDDLTHVINYEIPNIPETYVHRIGRTGRAGASGIAISFCAADEKEFLRDIQKLIGQTIPVEKSEFSSTGVVRPESEAPRPKNHHHEQKKNFKKPFRRWNKGGGGSKGKPSGQGNGVKHRPQV